MPPAASRLIAVRRDSLSDYHEELPLRIAVNADVWRLTCSRTTLRAFSPGHGAKWGDPILAFENTQSCLCHGSAHSGRGAGGGERRYLGGPARYAAQPCVRIVDRRRTLKDGSHVSLPSSRPSYGDDAISYVQLKREGNICTVKCKICPEHKVHAKLYAVTLIVDEEEEKVTSIQCHDCVAARVVQTCHSTTYVGP
ncbi:hypothetical protein EVAR_7849_1 [Eumeta japonica]|uniref:Uncharacterized protein n=1 Tax=Eumeta variegata TaxID=151549 RepID=A0A4C1TVZ8_EUMVA|nr:hypothetical protein EVAR_7849_1 [Eumeta japonica]